MSDRIQQACLIRLTGAEWRGLVSHMDDGQRVEDVIERLIRKGLKECDEESGATLNRIGDEWRENRMGRCIVCKKPTAIFAVPTGPEVGICVECKPKCKQVRMPDGRVQYQFQNQIWRQMLFPMPPTEMPEEELIEAADALRDTLEAVEAEIENRKDAEKAEDLQSKTTGNEDEAEEAPRSFLFQRPMAPDPEAGSES